MSEELTAEISATQLVPQKHGGALRRGGKIGHVGGTGRPKDAVREKLTKLAAGKGLRFLNKLMDGEVEVRLVGKCHHCGETGEADAVWVKGIIDALQTSVDQRIKGLEQAFKYGIGTRDEVDVTNHPEVQQFVQRLARATIEIAGEEVYQQISARIQELAA